MKASFSRRWLCGLALAGMLAVPGPWPATTVYAQVNELGQIDFPNSGAPEAQEDFRRGVLLLHSFEYDDAAEAFQAAQGIDPDFAMAYWGEAMTYYHPIWQEEEVETARAVLARLAPTAAERLAKAPTPRERGFLQCVEILYGEGRRKEQHLAYSEAMGRLNRRFPGDQEIASFYAVSILGTSHGVRDIPTYMRAAGVAEEVFAANQQHPGALHYLIHSYDDPVHAPLGLRQARIYAKVAPAAAHALHMPSHIYVALGMWDESAASNEDSSAAADARRERRSLDIEERGYHSLYWLAYTYLQQGRVGEASSLLRQMQKDAAESGSTRTRYHLAAMKTAHVVGTGKRQGELAKIPVRTDDLGLHISAAVHLVDGMTAAMNGDLTTARGHLETMQGQLEGLTEAEAEAVHAGCSPGADVYGATDPPGRQAARVMGEALRGFIQFKAGETAQAVETLRQAAELEDAMGFDFGPPVVVKPAHELLGEVLLDVNRPEEAMVEFKAALARVPRRSLSMLGLARAAARAGDGTTAEDTYAELATIWHRADVVYAPAVEAKNGGVTPSVARQESKR